MAAFRIVSINILADLSLWEKRSGLLVEQLGELNPDLVALQEVSLPHDTAAWLAKKLGYTHLFLAPKTGNGAIEEGVAILGRLPFLHQETLDLLTQERVAQSVQVSIHGQPFVVANGHFYWQPGDSSERERQVERLLAWLDSTPGNPPCVICGDFNSTPETRAIQMMRRRFQSAYAAIHGREPEYTTPTPLPRSKLFLLRALWDFRSTLRLKDLRAKWKGTLDYIFFDPRLHLLESRLVFDRPDPADARIYPSDHLGLYAMFELG